MANTFFFAWVDADTEFDPDVHNVEDEKFIQFSVEQTEGDFATWTISIKNPRIGFLNAGRKLWAYLSWDNGTDIVPLFFGRLVGIPSSINREIVELQFVARPVDFADQKTYLAETLRVLPYYDPVFIAEDKALDPDTVLEGRTEFWHVDRVTHVLTTSDIIEGDDVHTFTESEVSYDSVEISFDQPPIRKVRVEASVAWDQVVAGDANGLQVLKNYHVNTIGGKGLVEGWPDPGKSLNGGWTCASSRAASVFENVSDFDFGVWLFDPFRVQGPPFAVNVVSSHSASLSKNNVDSSTTLFCVLRDSVYLDLRLGYSASRKRSDVVRFELVADSQPIVTDPDDDDVVDLKISGNDVGLPLIAEGGIIPIGNVQRRSYFTQDRGQDSLQYLLQLARANIIMRSRAVKVSFKCKFDRAIALSLRDNATIVDHRLPGGTATGKIVNYTFKCDGGEISGTCTIACAIGYGGAWTALDGTPTYVDEGYVDKGYQVYAGERVILGANDIAFYPLVEDANDDGLTFPLTELPFIVAPHTVEVETVPLTPIPPTTTIEAQADDCGNTTNSLSSQLDTGPYNSWVSGFTTTVDFTLPSLKGGPFDTVYELHAELLKIPQQINLEAPSS